MVRLRVYIHLYVRAYEDVSRHENDNFSNPASLFVSFSVLLFLFLSTPINSEPITLSFFFF